MFQQAKDNKGLKFVKENWEYTIGPSNYGGQKKL